MAEYSRAFLVRYLRDVCALELTILRLNRRRDCLLDQIQRCDQGQYNPYPYRAAELPTVGAGHFFGAALALFFCAGGLAMLLLKPISTSGAASLIFFGLGGILLWGTGASARRNLTAQRDADTAREKKLQEYYRIDRENRALRKRIPEIQNELSRCNTEIGRAEATLHQVLGANIIPHHHRNIYVAFYLYERFSTGRADDLDAALRMYALEEHKEPLDALIADQGERIMGRYLMPADPQEQGSVTDTGADRDEKRDGHPDTPESSGAVRAYFAAADYIRSI